MKKFILFVIVGLLVLNIDSVGQNVNSEKKCIDCHRNLFERKIIHPSKNSCEDCHKSNGEEHPHDNNVKGFILAEKMPSLCYNCHDLIGKSKVLHQPATDGNCLLCHDVHQSDYPKLLLKEEKELCLDCHDKPLIVGTIKVGNIKKLLKKDNFVHKAIDRGCVICHSAHGSNNPLHLVKSFPAGEEYLQASTDSFALCFSCHDSKLFEEAVTETATNFRIGNENLHYLHVNRKKSRNCNRCHNAHGSANYFHINEKVLFGHWEMPIKFVKQENGGSCFPGCHSKKKYDRFGVPNVDSLSASWYNTNSKQHSNNINSSGVNNNQRLNEFNSLKFSDIKFVFASTQIVKNTDKKLINVINFMKKYPDCKIEIQGFTDNVGENAINRVLSQQRAEKVKQIMIDQGISHYRIYTIGYGKSNPVAPDDTEKSRAKNRRAEIKLVK